MMKNALSLLCSCGRNNFKQSDKLNKNSNNKEDEFEAIDFLTSKIEDDPPKITQEYVQTFNEIQNPSLNSPFSSVPTEIILKIFGLLSVRDLENVSLVCRNFKMIADQDIIWKTKCNISKKTTSKSYKQIYMDWTYGKYHRNEELQRLKEIYQTMNTACGLKYSPFPIFGFNQHPNSSDDMTIELSVDFDKTAHQLIILLEKTSKFRNKWRKKPMILQQMIRRYYRFMQLKILYPKNLLIPTIDIEIIWQTHLIRPITYRDDCLRLFHKIIDHSLILDPFQQSFKEEAFSDTCYLYQKHFHEEYCSLLLDQNNKISKSKSINPYFDRFLFLPSIYSYWDETYFKFSSYYLHDYENPFSFTEADIILDANWINLCKKFMNFMLLKASLITIWDMHPLNPIDLELSTIKQLKKSYERFLYMLSTYLPNKEYHLIHPTYAIDLIWHCHMQEPLNYAKDSHRLFGYIIDHCPWPSMEKYHIKQSYKDLNRYWKQEFQSDMSIDHLS